MNGIPRLFWFSIACLLVVGCARPRFLEPPPELPAELQGRKLWNTPEAIIYAREKAAAEETVAWIRDVQGHIGRTYRGTIGKGLVIVTDVDDKEPVITSLEALHRLETAPSPTASQPTLVERRKRLDESGLTEAQACRVATVGLDDEAVRGFGLGQTLPPEVQWRMCCPTDRLALKVTREFAPRAIEKKKGKAFATMAAPLMPVACVEAAKVFRLARDTQAFELWAARQSKWEARRDAETRRYMRERALLISPMLSLALTIAQSGQGM